MTINDAPREESASPPRHSSDRIPVAGPWITELEERYVAEAARNAWYSNANIWHERFERAFAERVNRRFAMALPSCTSAIHLTLAALGIGPGDEVIVPELTWIATAAPVTYVGATPVFCDIDSANWCISPQSAEQRITPRTRAIIAVDLYGSMPDMDALRELTERHNIALIEDAAEAVGSRFRNQPAGSFGDASVFSFHGSKTLTTGEGGILVTNDEALFTRAATLRDHGRKPGDTMFFNHEVAFKYKMSAMQAAMGLAQTERLNELVTRKREIFSWYRERLAGCDAITLNPELQHTFNSYWMVTAIFDRATQRTSSTLMPALDACGIDTRPFFHPLSSLPAYSAHPQTHSARRENPIAYDLAPRGINLPTHLRMTEDDVHRVCNALQPLAT